MTESRRSFGIICEDAAERLLRREGFRILARNFRCRRGEIDIVARERDCLVFVEVKGKRGARFGDPLEMVTRQKARRIVRAALVFMETHAAGRAACRFDVIAVRRGAGEEPLLEHVRGAFDMNDVRG